MRKRNVEAGQQTIGAIADQMLGGPTTGTRVPVQASPQNPDDSLLVVSLKQMGYDVTLTLATAWTVVDKQAAWVLIRAAGKTVPVPDFLRPYFVGVGKVPGMTDPTQFQQAGRLETKKPEPLVSRDPHPPLTSTFKVQNKPDGSKVPVGVSVPSFVPDVPGGYAVGLDPSVPDSERTATPKQRIDKASEELAREMKKPAQEGPPLFATANSGQAGIQPDIQRIVETVFAVDAWKDYEDIERNLEIGDQRVNYAVLMEALDKAERRARRAHALYLAAKLERERWELDTGVVDAEMRQAATDKLEEEKDKGIRKKQITDADVRSKMAELYPDEWKSQEMTRVKLRGTVEHLERLAELSKNRCFTLGTMLSNLRK